MAKNVLVSVFAFAVILGVYIMLPRPHAAEGTAATKTVICHSTGPGTYVQQTVLGGGATSASDIVPPAGGAVAKNWDSAHVAIFAYGCKTPPGVTKPVPPAPKAASMPYPRYTGPQPK